MNQVVLCPCERQMILQIFKNMLRISHHTSLKKAKSVPKIWRKVRKDKLKGLVTTCLCLGIDWEIKELNGRTIRGCELPEQKRIWKWSWHIFAPGLQVFSHQLVLIPTVFWKSRLDAGETLGFVYFFSISATVRSKDYYPWLLNLILLQQTNPRSSPVCKCWHKRRFWGRLEDTMQASQWRANRALLACSAGGVLH